MRGYRQSDHPEYQSDPSITIEALNDAIQELEILTRTCLALAKDAWNPPKLADIEDLFEKVQEAVAKGLGKVVNDYIQSQAEEFESNEPNYTRLFIAAKYRSIRGDLLKQPTTSDKDEIPLQDYAEYAKEYGCLAENALMVDLEHNKFFMPVAFWFYELYEKGLNLKDESRKEIKVSGFSQWLAINGLMYVDDKRGGVFPVYGFHFSFGEQVKKDFSDGFVSLTFAHETDVFSLTKIFMESLESLGCRFSKLPSINDHIKEMVPFKQENKAHKLPIISGDKEGIYKNLLEALFSSFFCSNFIELTDHDEHWIDRIGLMVNELPHDDHLIAVVSQLLKKYKTKLEKANQDQAEALCFAHMYTLLLNPGLAFVRKNNEDKFAALGTLNLFTNIELPKALIAIIRKHLEAIYHFLRDLEEWSLGEEEGFERQKMAYSHEVSNVTSFIFSRIFQPLSHPFNIVTGDTSIPALWSKPLGTVCLSPEVQNVDDFGFYLSEKMLMAASTQLMLWGGAKGCLSEMGIAADQNPLKLEKVFQKLIDHAKSVYALWAIGAPLIFDHETLQGVVIDFKSQQESANCSLSSNTQHMFWVATKSQHDLGEMIEDCQIAFARAVVASISNALKHARGEVVEIIIEKKINSNSSSDPNASLFFCCKNKYQKRSGKSGGTKATLALCIRHFGDQWIDTLRFEPENDYWVTEFRVPLSFYHSSGNQHNWIDFIRSK